MAKCKYCGQKKGVHKMGCETRKITIIMADITMCAGKGCDFKEKCYRHTAPKSKFNQSFFIASPIDKGKCDYYWNTEVNVSNDKSDKK